MQATPVKIWQQPDLATFRNEIQALQQPAILRGLVNHWPAVQLAKQGTQAICQYLLEVDNGTGVEAILLHPKEKGRLFYNEDMSGFNFARRSMPISAVLEQLLRYAHFPQHPAVAVQSARIADCMPAFLEQHSIALLPASVAPRIWIGNQVITPAHFDESLNLACVVAGRRRFTLFPPEQVANLYIGPLDFAPTPTPISMASLTEPDFARFPRLRTALAHALVAELDAGDALYIPTLWWHHVESLELFNVLVNYWWQDEAVNNDLATPFTCMLHCLQNMRDLPPATKQAWQALFAHYVFNAENDPAEHIPHDKRGVLTRKNSENLITHPVLPTP